MMESMSMEMIKMNGNEVEMWVIEGSGIVGEAWVCVRCEMEVKYLWMQEKVMCGCGRSWEVDVWGEEEEEEEEEWEMSEEEIEWMRKRGRM